jgi:FMN phosphatase YigB (HAD superfamily)
MAHLFDVMVISGAVGCRKPGQEIFAHFLRRTGADPADCLFVDDNPKNLAAASQLGFRTIRFVRRNPADHEANKDTMEWMNRLAVPGSQMTATDNWAGQQICHFRELLTDIDRL